MDLDHFKDVNDTFGHPAGDRLLVEIAQRLDEVTRRHDRVARLGGDEFAIVLTNVDTAQLALAEAQRIHDAVARPYQVSGISVQVDASIGVALSPQHGRDVDALLRCADIAMYAAKDQRSSCRVYDTMDDHHTPERLSLATELKAAIENDSIALGYQPTKDLTTDKVVGVEVLARWERSHPRGLAAADIHRGRGADGADPTTDEVRASYRLEATTGLGASWHRPASLCQCLRERSRIA